LVSSAPSTEARVAAWVYGIANVLLYSTSGTYHVFAKTLRSRRIMQSLDHAMIYVLIAGSATPVCLLLVDGGLRWATLALMWGGALTGMLLALTALDRFRKVTFGMYLGLGWTGLLMVPALWPHPGWLAMVGVAGVLYTVGAILFGLQRPRLNPAWFGYHEVWHVLGVAAGALLFVVNLGVISGAG
jgi:hemolysin III